jgi:hypothetical protein
MASMHLELELWTSGFALGCHFKPLVWSFIQFHNLWTVARWPVLRGRIINLPWLHLDQTDINTDTDNTSHPE